ncbi:serine/threonine-protein kinase [Streptomyces iconiensis]|uniref:Protein kinase n=1 Tax=Streptomyces iconiensis TaxID=1384038 RepID=A0ABT6ZQ71_9ACTN|nr:serine/threonine protein kinase [Streptomyces iconiensis]MDJ1131200.1 protein kinase [Streptomyces iconiensis]
MRNLEPADPVQVGRYRLLSRLGEGGMGRVYLARSERGRTVAVKLVQPDLARLPEFRQRFRQEVAVSQRVTGEWTAPVLDADTEAEQPWVATHYVPGPSLYAVVAEEYGPLPTEALRVLAHGLTRALREVHGVGLVHRDLKPANVLVTIDGPRLIDFGIARAVETATGSDLTRTGAVVGSPGFLSPEQVRGERVSPASDVFALGCVLAFAAGGRSPFGTAEGGQHALLFRVAEHAPDLGAVPPEWHAFIGACLEKAPERRPTVDQLLDATRPSEADGATPWLPATLIAGLGRHAAALLQWENPAPGADPAPPSTGTAHAGPGNAHPGPPPSTGAAGPAGPGPAGPGTLGPEPWGPDPASTGLTAPGPGGPASTGPPPDGPASTPIPSPPSGATATPPPAPAPNRAQADSLHQQAATGQEVIRLSSRTASITRFAQLAYQAQGLGYTYDTFEAGLTTRPALTLRRHPGPPGSQPATPFDLLKSRITVDGMGAYRRNITLLVGAFLCVVFGPTAGNSVISSMMGTSFIGALVIVAYLLLRKRDQAQADRLTGFGYRRFPDPMGRPRYQPAPQNPATPPPWSGTPQPGPHSRGPYSP